MPQTKKHQQDHRAPSLNLGNPVCSFMLKSSASSGPQPQSVMYKTMSSKYGSRPPTFESSPCVYHPLSQGFSEHLGVCGMFRDTSFNTSLDHSKVYDYPHLYNTI
ncbi:piercer of microtubule wall 2 protein isoform X2 [Neoarius graeffei]|nr:piercer of microtubule wall 2 protein isoform X2 [Neoarius graeffei]